MSHNLKDIAKTLFKYSILNGLESFVPFILVILLTRFLTPYEYGVWVLFVSFYSFIIPIIGGRFDEAIRMHHNDLSDDKLKIFISSCVVMNICLAVVCILAFYVFGKYISNLMQFPQEWLNAVLFCALFSSLFEIARAVLQFREKLKYMMYIIIFKILSTTTITYILLNQGLSFKAPIIGTIAGIIIPLCIVLALLYKSLGAKNISKYFTKEYYRKLTDFYFAYSLAGFGMIIIPLCDRLFISHYITIEEAGLYNIGGLYGSALYSLVINSFMLAWTPWLFKNLEGYWLNKTNILNLNKVRLVSILFYIILPIGGLILWQVSLFISPFIIANNFLDSENYILVMIISFVVQGYFLHNQIFLQFHKKSKLMSLNMALVIVLNIIGNYLGVKYYGAYGVAYATIFAYLIGTLVNGTTYYYLIRTSFHKSQ